MKVVLESIGLRIGDGDFWSFAAKFFRWWSNELWLSIPVSARNWFQVGNQEAFLRVHNDQLEVRRTEVPTEDWVPFIAEQHEKHFESRATKLVIPATVALRRSVELPFVAASTLHEATSFLIARVTPFEADQVYHVSRLIERNRASKTIRAEISIIPRAILDQMLTKLDRHHIQLSAILVDGDAGTPPLDFLFHHRKRFTRRRSGASKPILVASLILLLAAPFAAAYRTHATAGDLKRDVAAAGKVVSRAAQARSQLDALVATQNFLPERLSGPPAIEILDALARLIPDNTWLFRLELRAGDILLSGFSSDLPGLLQRLDAPPFATPELTSPVINKVASDQSRFDLRLRLKAITP